MIVDSGVIVEGCVQFVIFEIRRLRIGILNIYAQNLTAARAQLWSCLSHYPFPEANWIVGGDFNMTETDDDRSADYLEKAMGQQEQGAWSNFALALGVNDCFSLDDFRILGPKRHTWAKQNPVPKWSRLDRFYVNHTLQDKGGRTGIWPHLFHISDHAAIFLQINFGSNRVHQGPTHFNSALLKKEDTKEALIQAWDSKVQNHLEDTKAEQTVQGLKALMQENVRITRQEKKAGRAMYQSQFSEVKEAEAKLKTDWYDLDAWAQLNSAQQNLEEVRMDKLERQ